MDCTLMHKRVPVLAMTIDEDSAAIIALGECFAPEHLPVGIDYMHGKPNKATLNAWWEGRAIPASRSGLRDALEIMNVSYAQKLLVKCLGLSLSDQYWINPADTPLLWDDVNFFDNHFSEDVGNALFGQPKRGELDLMSPDNTSDGWLKKKWSIVDGQRILVKCGSNLYRQEPLNEVLATAVCRRLGIPHVPYTVVWEGDEPYSLCPDFITSDTELVSAWHITQTQKKPNNVSLLQHFMNCCDSLGIPGMREHLDRMLALDFIIANEDRHLNNFGAIRNAETLEWIGPAPIYDSGTSMWYSTRTIATQPEHSPSKPFKKTHAEQIKLAQSLAWIDFDALDGIEDEFATVLADSPYIDEARRHSLCGAIRTRSELLEGIAERMEQGGMTTDEAAPEEGDQGMTLE